MPAVEARGDREKPDRGFRSRQDWTYREFICAFTGTCMKMENFVI